MIIHRVVLTPIKQVLGTFSYNVDQYEKVSLMPGCNDLPKLGVTYCI